MLCCFNLCTSVAAGASAVLTANVQTVVHSVLNSLHVWNHDIVILLLCSH